MQGKSKIDKFCWSEFKLSIGIHSSFCLPTILPFWYFNEQHFTSYTLPKKGLHSIKIWGCSSAGIQRQYISAWLQFNGTFCLEKCKAITTKDVPDSGRSRRTVSRASSEITSFACWLCSAMPLRALAKTFQPYHVLHTRPILLDQWGISFNQAFFIIIIPCIHSTSRHTGGHT